MLKKVRSSAEGKYDMEQERDDFDQSRQRIREIPISGLEDKIAQITENDKVPAQRLGEIIARDPLLAFRLPRLANAIPGLPHPVSTVEQTVDALGLDSLKALALGISLFSADTNIETEGSSAILRQLWEHSIGCAMLAGRTAKKAAKGSPQLAFAAGFLHDIGRLLLYRHSREDYLKSAAVAVEKNIPITEAEILASGCNHLELGEIWSERMQLHKSFKEVIRYHHEPVCMLPDFITDEVRKMVVAVRMADLACERQGLGSGGESADGLGELWSGRNVRPAEMSDELRALKLEIKSAWDMFNFREAQVRKTWPLRHSRIPVEAGLLSEWKKIAAGARRGQLISFPVRNDGSPQRGENGSAKRLTILVVEDHGALCEMLSLYLMRYGYHVRTADNGQAALDLLSKEDIDLVLLDLMLPRLDGFAVLKYLRETFQDKKPYIIIVSAGASEKDRSRVLELGANEYMPKPFHLTRLLERIRAVETYLLR